LQPIGAVAWPEAVLQATHSRREGGSPKLEPYKERIEHGKVCHVYHCQRKGNQFLLDDRAPIKKKSSSYY